jgi:hypothetical protein
MRLAMQCLCNTLRYSRRNDEGASGASVAFAPDAALPDSESGIADLTAAPVSQYIRFYKYVE